MQHTEYKLNLYSRSERKMRMNEHKKNSKCTLWDFSAGVAQNRRLQNEGTEDRPLYTDRVHNIEFQLYRRRRKDRMQEDRISIAT